MQRWERILRQALYNEQMKALSALSGEVEMDETVFGGKVPGRRGWVLPVSI
jgi:transposase